MALSGKFEADFSAFQKACEDSETKLKSMSTGAEKVGTAMNRMVDDFSGRKIIQEATVMAEAFDKLRGQGIALTNAELAKMGAVAEAAANKLRALGQDVPPGIQHIADAARGLQAGPMTSMLGSATELAGAFGIAFGVEKVAEFAASVVTGAAAVADLAQATGLSTTAVQELTYVGAAFGLDAETMAKAVEQLSARLAGGDKSAVGAVQALGLNVKALIASGPKEAFLTVADAAGHVEDPMNKGAVAAELFGGKLGKVLLPALGELRAQLAAVPKDAIISDENIKRADAFDDALHQMTIRAKAWTAEGLGLFVSGFEALKVAFTEPIVPITDLNAKIAEHQAATESAITADDLMANTLKAWRTEGVEPLTAAQTAAIEEGLKFGKSQDEIAKAVGASAVAVHQYADSFKAAAIEAKKFDDAVAEVDSVGVGFQGTINTIDGAVVEAMRDLTAAGVSVKTLGTYFDLTEAQGKAFTAMLRAEQDQTKQQIAIDKELLRARTEHNAAIIAGDADSTEKQIANARLAAEAKIAAMKLAGSYSAAAENEIWQTFEQTEQKIRKSTLESSAYSKEHYEKLAADAKRAYDSALATAGSRTAAEVQMLAEKWRNAESASQHWAAQANEDLEKIAGGAKKTAAAVDTVTAATNRSAAASKAAAASYTFDVPQLTKQQFDAMGGQQRIAQVENQYAIDPGRRAGGSGSTGLASSDYIGYQTMLQEQRDYAALTKFAAQDSGGSAGGSSPTPEWAMPAAAVVTTGYSGGGVSGAIAARGGTTTVINITNHNNGDAETVARAVSDSIVQTVRSMPGFG